MKHIFKIVVARILYITIIFIYDVYFFLFKKIILYYV